MSEQTMTIYGRFIAAQSEFDTIAKDKTAKAFTGGAGYAYADINAVLQDVRPILNKHGLGLTQSVTTDEEHHTVAVTTTLFTAAGEKIESGIFTASTIGLTQRGVQALGSAITYARRYSLMGFLGLALGDADDDGRSASDTRYSKPQARRAAPAPQSAPAPAPAAEQTHPVVNGSESFEMLLNSVGTAKSISEIDAVGKRIAASSGGLSADQVTHLRSVFKQRKESLTMM